MSNALIPPDMDETAVIVRWNNTERSLEAFSLRASRWHLWDCEEIEEIAKVRLAGSGVFIQEDPEVVK